MPKYCVFSSVISTDGSAVLLEVSSYSRYRLMMTRRLCMLSSMTARHGHIYCRDNWVKLLFHNRCARSGRAMTCRPIAPMSGTHWWAWLHQRHLPTMLIFEASSPAASMPSPQCGALGRKPSFTHREHEATASMMEWADIMYRSREYFMRHRRSPEFIYTAARWHFTAWALTSRHD